jgi:hypothetical protein
VPVPLPDPDAVDRTTPDAALAQHIAAGLVSAARGSRGLTPLQRVLIESIAGSMTGFSVTVDVDVMDPETFARGLAHRDEGFRIRILQIMILTALVVRPLPNEIADRLDAFAAALSVGDGMLDVVHDFASESFGLAAVDFDRNGYTRDWSHEHRSVLHTSDELQDAWATSTHDAELAGRWCALEQLPEGTLGRRVTELYRARGFEYPGRPGSAPPLLAQHDWVHVLADYGTCVESELEVFAFIARANDDPRGFGLLAMVVSLFETGALAQGAGLFEAFPGQLSHTGVAVRLADAMRRGALVRGSVDFMDVDWFELAPLTIEAARDHFGVVPKGEAAIAAGSVGPWELGGISEFQLREGRRRATELGVPYESFGAGRPDGASAATLT